MSRLQSGMGSFLVGAGLLWGAAQDERAFQGNHADRVGVDPTRLDPEEPPVPTIVVEVMPKPELLDPAGKAVVGALHRLGHDRVSDVRIGKRFELTVDAVDDALLASIETVAADILSNDVIETVLTVTVLDEGPAGETH